MRLSTLFLLSSSLFMSACGQAKTDAEAGKEKSAVCASCHGTTGRAEIPIYPNLQGQNAPYLEMALKAYRDQSRTGMQAQTMYALTAQLSDEDIKQLAAYYSTAKQ